MITIVIPIGAIAIAAGILIVALWAAWRLAAARRLRRRRTKQKAARMQAIERAMRPPLWQRLRNNWGKQG